MGAARGDAALGWGDALEAAWEGGVGTPFLGGNPAGSLGIAAVVRFASLSRASISLICWSIFFALSSQSFTDLTRSSDKRFHDRSHMRSNAARAGFGSSGGGPEKLIRRVAAAPLAVSFSIV